MGLQRDAEGRARLDFARLRANEVRFGRTEADAPSHALPSMVGRVLTDDATIKLNCFCRVAPVTVLGSEGEGQPGIFSPTATATVPVFVDLIGTFVPSEGDYLVCRFVDHRWVAETSGGSQLIPLPGTGILLPSCACLVPPTLQMTSADADCNYGMFQSCSLQYGPPPPAMQALNFTANVFTSSASFVDQITGATFFYYFACRYNQFLLTRIFPESPMGSPFRDGILYSWLVGGYGNTCVPFNLLSGTPFPGSDTSCSVSITG